MRTYTGEEFEDEVRRIARNLYSDRFGQGAQKIDGRERDGVFWNGSFFTVVEATTDKKKDKALYDAKKTHELVAKKRSEGFMAQGFVVTLHEPTADQRAAVKKYERTTSIISFDELRSKLFDAHGYIRTRSERPFGSIFDHVSHSYAVPRSEFVEPTILDGSGCIVGVRDLEERVLQGKRFVITSEYGIGKSMLLREVFFALSSQFESKKTFRFPVAINLREHIGQDDPIELIERHARHIAADPRKLVSAWSAGYVDLLVDGFDELSTRGWTGDHRKLREFRRSTHMVVKRLIQHTPSASSVVISGRDAYFDSESEMREVLGLPAKVYELLRVQPFDAEQAREFLRKKNFSEELPAWVPARPLFISYLINKGLLADVVSVTPKGAFPEGYAWSSLLEMIAERESNQSEGVDKAAILEFWGLMATKARQNSSLDKSFSPAEMDQIFHSATGNTVSEDERRLLLRLPGLGVAPDNAANRIFVDPDFLNAASANLIYRHISHPYGDEEFRGELRSVRRQISNIGAHVICAKIEAGRISAGVLDAALQHELKQKRYPLAFDIFEIIAILSKLNSSIYFEGLEIDEIDICLEVFDGVEVGFSNCLIENLIAPASESFAAGVRFSECLIGRVEGRSSEMDLPAQQFVQCEFGEFSESFVVNNDVLASSMPLGLRVLIVSLRKIYAQSGISRLESALTRGLDHRAKMVAPEVIAAMERHHFLTAGGRNGKTIYAGTRTMRKVALQIMQAPLSHPHPIIEDCMRIA